MRLHKYMAECGVASRRACERIIEEGCVKVDGVVVRELGTTIDPQTQRVEVEGRRIRPESFRYLMYNKPRGVLSALSDPRGRGTLADVLPPDVGRVYHVGRLDQDSEGLLLLTNDGELAARLMHPRHEVEKSYRVTCEGDLDATAIAEMQRGIRDEGEVLRARRVERVERGLYTVVLTEGKKREIRRLFAACGCPVQRLVRIAVGTVRLGALATGKFRDLSEAEIAALRSITGSAGKTPSSSGREASARGFAR
ncbi:MAG: rRNA pseudouridine synthase [Kiritimatiellae bacterium]|nr:rRNA pseudouridine synthase [Kiritimatiellia bacterium]